MYYHGNSWMEAIEKKYIVDDENRKIAVQIPIKAFEKIEEILEDYALGQLMKDSENDEILGENEAKEFYSNLKKSSRKYYIGKDS